MKTKVCKKCSRRKSRDKFYKLCGTQYKKEWDCRDSYCKTCRIKDTTDKRRVTKILCVEYLGSKCADCKLKTKHYSVYDFHHEGKKDFTISDRCSMSFEKLKSELDKCILLCANCHRIRHEPK